MLRLFPSPPWNGHWARQFLFTFIILFNGYSRALAIISGVMVSVVPDLRCLSSLWYLSLFLENRVACSLMYSTRKLCPALPASTASSAMDMRSLLSRRISTKRKRVLISAGTPPSSSFQSANSVRYHEVCFDLHSLSKSVEKRSKF